jgi:hypothetical protein
VPRSRRLGPITTLLTLWELWRRLPPRQRQWLVEQARVQGPRLVKQAMDAQKARRKRP